MAMVRLILSAYIASGRLGQQKMVKGWERVRNTTFAMVTFGL
jgi:hypothetical protein